MEEGPILVDGDGGSAVPSADVVQSADRLKNRLQTILARIIAKGILHHRANVHQILRSISENVFSRKIYSSFHRHRSYTMHA